MLSHMDLILYITFGSGTIVLSSIVALTFITSKELRQHPSGLIVSISICEVIMAYHSIIFALGSERFVEKLDLDLSLRIFGIAEKNSLGLLCGNNQIILSAATVACFCYNIAICLDLTITLYNPLIPGHVRKNWYHGITALAVVYFTIYLNVLNKFFIDCESNENNRLEINNTGSINILLLAYLLIAIVSIIYAFYRFMNGLKIDSQKANEYLLRHILYVTIFILCWTCPAISYLMRTFGVKHQSSNFIDSVAIGTTSCSGFLLGLVRISDPVVRKRIKNLTKFDLNESNIQQNDAWTQPVSVVVESNLNAELTQCIFRSIHTSFLELKSKVVDFDDIQEEDYVRKDTRKVTQGVNEMKAWGVNDPHLKGVLLDFYATDIFLDIINKSGLSLDQILTSLDPENNINNSVDQSCGKSGSFFLFTNDKRLSIKTIKRNERKTMLKFLQKYHMHVVNFPKSLLCRVYGVFSISIPGVTMIDLILMQNVFYQITPLKVYDIKGSTAGRTSKKKSQVSGPLKDLDFLELKDRLYIIDEDIELLRFIILKDVKLLKENNLMDYSLLVATSTFDEKIKYMNNSYESIIKNEMYTLGIIDFLTEYGNFKIFERNIAALRFGKKVKEASVANPRMYSNRFYNFIFSVIIPVIKRNSSFVLSEEVSLTDI